MSEAVKKHDTIPLSIDGTVIGYVCSTPMLTGTEVSWKTSLMIREISLLDKRYATVDKTVNVAGNEHLELLCRTLAKHLDLVVAPNE